MFMKKLLITLALSAPMHAQAAEICNFFFDVEAFNKEGMRNKAWNMIR